MLFTYTPQMHMRRPASCRIVKPASQSYGLEQLIYSPYMQPDYARREPLPVQSFTRELAPLFQLFENALESFMPTPEPERKPFAPRFEARETKDAYELRGEVPGIEAKNLHVEFTDPQTLVIRGSTGTQSTPQVASAPAAGPSPSEALPAETTTLEPTPTASPAVETAQPTDDWTMIDSEKENDTTSIHSDSASSYHKPTVEDEETGEIESSSAPVTSALAAASTTSEQSQAETTAVVTPAPQVQQQEQSPDTQEPAEAPAHRQSKSFQQTFRFQSRIDQDGVKAGFKDGVLDIRVPKAVAPRQRTIFVY